MHLIACTTELSSQKPPNCRVFVYNRDLRTFKANLARQFIKRLLVGPIYSSKESEWFTRSWGSFHIYSIMTHSAEHTAAASPLHVDLILGDQRDGCDQTYRSVWQSD